jgi:hypothetical protein
MAANTFSERIYSAVLFLYPRELRQQFGQEMLEVFSRQIRDAYQKKGWIGEIAICRCVAGESIRILAERHTKIAGISISSVLVTYALMDVLFWFMGFH